MSRAFVSRVRHVAPGSPVSSGNTSRPTRQLEARENYLEERLDGIEAQQLLVYPEQTIIAEAEVGQPVYWNKTTQQFELALAGVEPDPESGTLVPLESSDCLGLVLRKLHATLADIATIGVAKFSTLAAAIDGDLIPGRYYLSSAEAGKLTRQRPAVSVPVCHVIGPQDDCDQNVWAVVHPQTRDFLESHIHYRFDLVCHPAGDTVPPTDGHHTITNADAGLAGWLPADDASFNGHAPTGANFGYNLAAHPELAKLWPPIPLEAVVVFWDRGDGSLRGATEIPTRGFEPRVIIDRYGIWWMTDCTGEVPWPPELDTFTEASASLSSQSLSSGQEICPPTDHMRLILAYASMLFATDKSVVTSLEPDTDQPISFVNCDSAEAKTGALKARLDLSTSIGETDAVGSQVLKQIVGPGFKFDEGYVVEGIIAGNDNIVITSDQQRYETPGDPETDVVHQGIITLDVNLEPGERELSPVLTKLQDALERTFRGVAYLGLPTDRDSAVRMRFEVPVTGLPSNPKLVLRTWLFGRGIVGPWSEVTAGYYRLALPTDGSPTAITEGDTALTFDVVDPSDGVAADHVIVVESNEFTIAPGDTIYIQLSRADDASPSYDNDIGIVRAVGVIVSGG